MTALGSLILLLFTSFNIYATDALNEPTHAPTAPTCAPTADTPAPVTPATMDPFTGCFNIAPNYCNTSPAGRCFSTVPDPMDPKSSETVPVTTCAKCWFPYKSDSCSLTPICTNITGPSGNSSIASPNSTTFDLSYSCSAQYPNDCCIPGSKAKGFKEKRKFIIRNKCEYPIWIGISGGIDATVNEINLNAKGGGFKLDSNETEELNLINIEGFNIWARTNCEFKSGAFTCDTGQCSSSYNLHGKDGKCCGDGVCNGPKAPASLVEFTLAQSSCANDFYDVSLVDGYNIPVSVEPFNYNVSNYNKTNDTYLCGTASIQTFDVKSQCPNVLLMNGNETRDKTSTNFDFSSLSYCLSPCHAVNESDHRRNFDLLRKWYENTNAAEILIGNYSASTLTKRYVDDKPLLDLLCCQCGNRPPEGNDCYTSSQCNFGCSPFITGGWNATSKQTSTWTWNALKKDPKDYEKRECPNYGYKTYSSGFDEQMPLWPLLGDMNPAYIYKNTSPNAYSWPFADQSSTFHCKNADYKIVFCHDQEVGNGILDDYEEMKTTSDDIDRAHTTVLYTLVICSLTMLYFVFNLSL